MILNKNIQNFERIIKFKFKNKEYLIQALVHPSFIKKKKYKNINLAYDFERLEFLGDRVLGIAIAYLIFDKFKVANEGDLTKKLSYLVQKEFLYKIALEISLDKILKFSNKKENTRMNLSILADAVESLIGSIFIDSGYNASLKFIKYIWGPYLDIEASNKQDPKTKLQELSQKTQKTVPKYTIFKKEGPPHSPIFTISLKVLDLKIIKATGKSKQDAEKKAATIALKLINEK